MKSQTSIDKRVINTVLFKRTFVFTCLFVLLLQYYFKFVPSEVFADAYARLHLSYYTKTNRILITQNNGSANQVSDQPFRVYYAKIASDSAISSDRSTLSIEMIQGTIKNGLADAQMGTCSGEDCVTHDVQRGVVKVEEELNESKMSKDIPYEFPTKDQERATKRDNKTYDSKTVAYYFVINKTLLDTVHIISKIGDDTLELTKQDEEWLIKGNISQNQKKSVHQSTQTIFTQTDWSGGEGQSIFSDNTRFLSSDNILTYQPGEVTIDTLGNWHNANWAKRQKLIFDNSASTEDLIDFPIMVKLNDSRVYFSHIKTLGQDLLFVDSDGTTILPYEIENWDETGTGFIWVRVPHIPAGSTDDFIYVYYNNPSATISQNASDVWRNGFMGVWHMSPDSMNQQLLDSTGNGYHSNLTYDFTEAVRDSIMGKTLMFNTKESPGHNPISFQHARGFINDNDFKFDTGSEFTINAWAKYIDPGPLSNYGAEFPCVVGNQRWNVSPRQGFVLYARAPSQGGNAILQFLYSNASATVGISDNQMLSALNTWRYWSVSTSPEKIRIFADGNLGGEKNNDGLQALNAACLTFGSSCHGYFFFRGLIDEVRISNVARSASWTRAEYLNGTDKYIEYKEVGRLTSSIIDTGFSSQWETLSYTAQAAHGTDVKIRLRTSSSADMSGTPEIRACPEQFNSTTIQENACVRQGDRYIQYMAELTSRETPISPVLRDVTIMYSEIVNPVPTTQPNTPNPDPTVIPDITPVLTYTEPTSTPILSANSQDPNREVSPTHEDLGSMKTNEETDLPQTGLPFITTIISLLSSSLVFLSLFLIYKKKKAKIKEASHPLSGNFIRRVWKK